MRGGKVVWPKQRKPPSPEEMRNKDADELIAALVDAAHTIGVRGIVDNYSKYDFHLYPRHIADLFPKDHPKHSVYAAKDMSSKGRVIVPWPLRESLEPYSTNELREKPFEIIGLLMRRVLDADSAFFEALAEKVRTAKIEAKQAATAKDSSFHPKGKTRAGRIVAKMPSLGMMGDPDWFTRIIVPRRQSKAPYAIWKLCKASHVSHCELPTRRDIREHLQSLGIPCSNLTVVLGRLNLLFLKEGGRRSKT